MPSLKTGSQRPGSGRTARLSGRTLFAGPYAPAVLEPLALAAANPGSPWTGPEVDFPDGRCQNSET